MSEWVSVDERLPDMYQQCLVCLPDADDGLCITVAHWNGDTYKFIGVDGWKIRTATHWMPLPQPPETSK